MPRAEQNKLYRTFVKGLVTEASPLTYPENASIDENNCVIFRKGNRTRRLGFQVEPDGTFELLQPDTGFDYNIAQQTYHWKSPANVEGLNLLCQQVGSRIHFYDMAVSPLSAGRKNFYVDLALKSVTTDPNFAGHKVQFAQGKGFLFIAGQDINPLYVKYNAEYDGIDAEPIIIQIRDFEGVDDGLANDQEPSTLSNEHAYNLVNQGWAPSAYAGTSGTAGGSGTTADTQYINPVTGGIQYYPNVSLPNGIQNNVPQINEF